MACKPSQAAPGAAGPSIDGFRPSTVDERLVVEEQSQTSTAAAIAARAAEQGEELSRNVDLAAEYADENYSPINRDKSTVHNIVGGAISFGLGLMIIVLMALVTGYFVAEVPANGEFSEAINTTTDIGGTGFIIFGVVLLAVPVVALIGYFMRSGLGGFINGGMGR
jgi:ABC-type phosphate transport system permease subunit